MTVAYEEIIYEVENGVATITINRPDQLNALTDLTQAEIRHALHNQRLTQTWSARYSPGRDADSALAST